MNGKNCIVESSHYWQILFSKFISDSVMVFLWLKKRKSEYGFGINNEQIMVLKCIQIKEFQWSCNLPNITLSDLEAVFCEL